MKQGANKYKKRAPIQATCEQKTLVRVSWISLFLNITVTEITDKEPMNTGKPLKEV